MNGRQLGQIVTLCALVGASAPARAIQEPETKQVFPDQVPCDGAKAIAAAAGVREAAFGVDVYGVVLYVAPEAKGKSVTGTEACVCIRARFVRDVGADKIREAWISGLKKHGLSAGDAAVKQFLGLIGAEMKKGGEMVMTTHGDKVVFKYMKRSVTIAGARKLAGAIKKVYLGSGSPTPALSKDLGRRGVAKP